jgi:hypothetical protein
LCFLYITQIVTGCASGQLGPYRPIPIEDDIAWIKPMVERNLADFDTFPPDQQAVRRNEVVSARMYLADLEYNNFESRLTKELQDEGLLTTATALGLTTGATLIAPATTKTILSALATGVIGLDKLYVEKELLSNTMQALQTQMRADRKAEAAVILSKMMQDTGNSTKVPTPIDQYPLAMALSDADHYYQAGTIASALIGLTKTVSNAETNAENAKAQAGPNAPQVVQAKIIAAPPPILSPSVGGTGTLNRLNQPAAPSPQPPQPPPPPIRRNAPPPPASFAPILPEDDEVLRKVFELPSTVAARANSPAFQEVVKLYQRCLNEKQTGHLTPNQKQLAKKGQDSCLPINKQPAGAPPSPAPGVGPPVQLPSPSGAPPSPAPGAGPPVQLPTPPHAH